MTARHNPRPRPSKRAIRREQQAHDAVMARLLAALLAGNPIARAHVQRHVDMLTSPAVRDLSRTLTWRLGRFHPLAPGMVTWPARRRRHRRTR